MPSVNYYNQTAPFWDWVASLEDQGQSHPFFRSTNRGEESDNDQQPPNPWTQGWGGFPFGPMPHRGRQGGPRHHHPSPPPPPPPGPMADDLDHDMPPQPADMEHNLHEGPSGPRGPPHFSSEKHPHGPPHRGPGSGPGMKGRCGSGPGRGGLGGRGRGGKAGHHGFPFGGPGPMAGFGALANMFQDQIFGNNDTMEKGTEDINPEVDVFDTTDSFVVHVSLPGAKKEDVGVSWDQEKSELIIGGVIYRPGDEELLKTLALNERKVGAFERKVRLGSRANPAQVDVDAITAKLEDGVLRVDVPKMDSGYVEVKKVDIE
ncbi:hypothetical protein B0A50_06629 [Salinomyces thailandicus]|uniref:SHSP domain-containing protein n=1 Tax=Salinomyces thailandicus TaxID=706561 RepID=A0A4U0TRH2_9PEZI|nr:hypothetical protein B0A50_06629 [Salinomyces thailandica]